MAPWYIHICTSLCVFAVRLSICMYFLKVQWVELSLPNRWALQGTLLLTLDFAHCIQCLPGAWNTSPPTRTLQGRHFILNAQSILLLALLAAKYVSDETSQKLSTKALCFFLLVIQICQCDDTCLCHHTTLPHPSTLPHLFNRTTSLLSGLLFALPNCPLAHPVQGFTVRPLTSTLIPGLPHSVQLREHFNLFALSALDCKMMQVREGWIYKHSTKSM